MNEPNYKPSFLFLDDTPGKKPIYYDFLIVYKDGITWHYAAWGDGAHVCQVAAHGLETSPLTAQGYCYHNNQLEDFFRQADDLIAVLNHKVVYKKVA